MAGQSSINLKAEGYTDFLMLAWMDGTLSEWLCEKGNKILFFSSKQQIRVLRKKIEPLGFEPVPDWSTAGAAAARAARPRRRAREECIVVVEQQLRV